MTVVVLLFPVSLYQRSCLLNVLSNYLRYIPKRIFKIWLRGVCLKQLVIFLCRLRALFSFVFFLFFGMVSLQLLKSFSFSVALSYFTWRSRFNL